MAKGFQARRSTLADPVAATRFRLVQRRIRPGQQLTGIEISKAIYPTGQDANSIDSNVPATAPAHRR